MNRSPLLKIGGLLLAIAMIGGLMTASVAHQSVRVDGVDVEGRAWDLDEEAYYEYVVPRLNALVTEVNSTRDMVETKSRNIMALTRAGTVIETLTAEIREYGEQHGVPPLFADVHAQILTASDTVNDTFDAARDALRTFNFSGMTALVAGFGTAADEFTASQLELQRIYDEQSTT